MGIFRIGLAGLLEVGGSLSRGTREEGRLRLPAEGFRSRTVRDESGLFQWSGGGRRGLREKEANDGRDRASVRPAG